MPKNEKNELKCIKQWLCNCKSDLYNPSNTVLVSTCLVHSPIFKHVKDIVKIAWVARLGLHDGDRRRSAPPETWCPAARVHGDRRGRQSNPRRPLLDREAAGQGHRAGAPPRRRVDSTAQRLRQEKPDDRAAATRRRRRRAAFLRIRLRPGQVILAENSKHSGNAYASHN